MGKGESKLLKEHPFERHHGQHQAQQDKTTNTRP